MYNISYILLTVAQSFLDDPCGLNAPINIDASTSGDILSPNHPGDYPNDADCSWQIEATAGQVVQLSFVEFNVELE